MAAIKSYTDIEQSRKLAEILPLESADMYYALSEDESAYIINLGKPQGFFVKTQVAWSLTALLGVLPYGYSSILTKSFDGKDYYCKIDGETFETDADNPVDACVAMIEKLNELKML